MQVWSIIFWAASLSIALQSFVVSSNEAFLPTLKPSHHHETFNLASLVSPASIDATKTTLSRNLCKGITKNAKCFDALKDSEVSDPRQTVQDVQKGKQRDRPFRPHVGEKETYNLIGPDAVIAYKASKKYIINSVDENPQQTAKINQLESSDGKKEKMTQRYLIELSLNDKKSSEHLYDTNSQEILDDRGERSPTIQEPPKREERIRFLPLKEEVFSRQDRPLNEERKRNKEPQTYEIIRAFIYLNTSQRSNGSKSSWEKWSRSNCEEETEKEKSFPTEIPAAKDVGPAPIYALFTEIPSQKIYNSGSLNQTTPEGNDRNLSFKTLPPAIVGSLLTTILNVSQKEVGLQNKRKISDHEGPERDPGEPMNHSGRLKRHPRPGGSLYSSFEGSRPLHDEIFPTKDEPKFLSERGKQFTKSRRTKLLSRKKTDVYSTNTKGNFANSEKKIGKIQEKIGSFGNQVFQDDFYFYFPSMEILRSKRRSLNSARMAKSRRRSKVNFRKERDITSSSISGDHTLESPINFPEEVNNDWNLLKAQAQDSKTGKGKNGSLSLARKRRELSRRRYQMDESVSPQFQFTPIDQTVSQGVPVSLKCSATGSPLPIISWTRDGETLIPTSRTRLGSFRLQDEIVSYVNISDVTSRDGGLFRCSAHNSAGMATFASRLHIYGPPFIRSMKNVSVLAGEDAVFWCPAGGFPVPTVTWEFLAQTLPIDLRQETYSNNTLIVRGAKEEDKGRYTCIAKGRGGQRATAETFLSIINPPVIKVFGFSPPLEEGKRTQLNCMVSSGDLPITMQWLKNGRHLRHDLAIEQKQISEYSVVLLFTSLAERHSGQYTCVAANSAAAANQTMDLNVKVPPKWILSPSELHVAVGRAVRFECMARGVPQPAITWFKFTDEDSRDFQRIRVDSHRVQISENGTLSISKVTKLDAVDYLCQADNGVGPPLSKIAKLTVSAGPEITSSGRRLVAHAGRTTKLDCEAKGDAPLLINWRKDGRLISDNQRITLKKMSTSDDVMQSTLSFEDMLPIDAGFYVCEATNNHGRAEETYNLVVLEPPSPPTSLRVDEVMSRSVKLSWNAPQPASVIIQLKEADYGSWADTGKNISVDRNTNTFVVSSLTPFVKYAVRVFSENELGVSAPSEVIGFVTQEEAPSGSPQNIRVSSPEPGALRISWKGPVASSIHGEIRGYVIAIRKQNIRGDYQYIARPASHYGSEPRQEEYIVRGLTPHTLYEVALMVFNRMGTGPLSLPRIVQSTAYQTPGCPPDGVSCKGDVSGIRVWWESPRKGCANAPITGYSILATPTRKFIGDFETSGTKEVLTTNLEKNIGMIPSSSNISVVLRAYNSQGFSGPTRNIFCRTFDNEPMPPRHLRLLSIEPGSFIAVWLPPANEQRTIVRYTMYYDYNNKMNHIIIPNVEADSSWKKVSGFQERRRVMVWVSASSSGGEGIPTSKKSVTIVGASSSNMFGPFAISSRTIWDVPHNSAVTLQCRGLGSPRPTLSWIKNGRTLMDDPRHQILPGGDLHLIPELSANYTCRSSNSLGDDDLKFHVMALSPPSVPVLRVNEVTRTALNMSINALDDGGAPILGFNIYQRYHAAEWYEKPVAKSATNGPTNFMLRNLLCGSEIQLYATAWNSQGSSSASEVLSISTKGSLPLKPQPSTLVEVNSTCITLRLYAWPENECPVQYWKVEGKHETANEWRLLFPKVGRELRDIGFCELQRTEPYLLNIIAHSDSGSTKVTYKIFLLNFYSEWKTSEYVQEISMDSETLMSQWMDAHVIAGVVSAFLLTAAVVICICVIFKKRCNLKDGNTTTPKEKESKRLSHHCGNVIDYRVYSPLPSKKFKPPRNSPELQRRRSSPSLVPYSDDDILSAKDIYPYATFSAGSVDETLQYGISLHTHSPTSRDCFEGAQRRNEDVYSSRKERGIAKFKESDVDFSYSPSKRMSNDRGRKARLGSSSHDSDEPVTNDIKRFGDATTLQLTERTSRDKNKRPNSRIKGMMAPIAVGSHGDFSSPNHQDFLRSIPIQTLYGGPVRNSANTGNKEATVGRHAR